MAFDLNSITSGKSTLPPRVVVYGRQKMGKSTFGAEAKKPLFLPFEDGIGELDVSAFPKIQTWGDLGEVFQTLMGGEHGFETVVLDSADWMEAVIHKHIVASDPKANNVVEANGGYGKGYILAATMFSQVLDTLDDLREQQGVMPIVICHSKVVRFQDPVQGGYDKYTLKLHDRTSELLKEWADVMGFANTEMAIITDSNGFKEQKRAVDTGNSKHYLYLQQRPSFDAGCRMDMPAKIEFRYAEFDRELQATREAVKF